jgi:hypothetical protein
MKILFCENQLGLRGTTVAMYDYAHYNEELLGNISYVAAPIGSDMSALKKFQDRFDGRIFFYSSIEGLEEYCKSTGISYAYIIKAGFNDGKIIPGIKNFVHAVFDGSQPHGNVYMAVSEWLGNKHNIDYLPHIVSLPESAEDYRDFLHIPKDAIVFGRHGGFDQFDVPYLSDAIISAANQGRYFLLMNTKPLSYNHSNIIYLDSTTDLYNKTAFINTCDYMVHGRTDGESFGLAICEFLHQNKPVITNINCRDKHHIELMNDKGYYYSSANELYDILMSMEKKEHQVKSLVDQFKPEIVMNKLKEVFFD